ncbi:long-chain-fatty-acid CoA ligase [Striga asiatica]|uniref:Long-chain-fatty-acid CoA ligase n=1 Tax=Striga asiatica TaxID=4170 RepID=A0A5A7QP33_STRAF|nr:long-chain-fatty-acid CoA ligase [Striga asiatica]
MGDWGEYKDKLSSTPGSDKPVFVASIEKEESWGVGIVRSSQKLNVALSKDHSNPSDKPSSSVRGCSPVTKAIVADNNDGQLSCHGKKTELAVLIPMELDSNCEEKGDESNLVDIPVGDPLIQESVIGRKKKSFVRVTRKVEADSKLNLSTGKLGLNLDNKEGVGHPNSDVSAICSHIEDTILLGKAFKNEEEIDIWQIPKEQNKIKEERLLLLVRE